MIDHDLFTRLWTHAQPVVAGYIRATLQNRHDAEDILQDVAVVLLHKFSSYDPQREFVAWALSIAKLELLSSRRAQARSLLLLDQRVLDAVTQSYAELAPELGARADALERCLSGVQGRPLETLQLRFGGALKTHEIASRTGDSHEAVRVLLSRTLAALKACIERRLAASGRPA